jgi:hypothetical protein
LHDRDRLMCRRRRDTLTLRDYGRRRLHAVYWLGQSVGQPCEIEICRFGNLRSLIRNPLELVRSGTGCSRKATRPFNIRSGRRPFRGPIQIIRKVCRRRDGRTISRRTGALGCIKVRERGIELIEIVVK